MGSQKYVKFCYDGKLDHVSGGDIYDSIYDQTLKRRYLLSTDRVNMHDSVYDQILRHRYLLSTPKYKLFEKPTDYVTFIFVKAHNCRCNKTISQIVTIMQFGDDSLRWTKTMRFIPNDMVFETDDPLHRSIYDKLTKFNAFSPIEFMDLLTEEEKAMYIEMSTGYINLIGVKEL